MNNPLISVILPVYNGLKYLPQCVESLQKQTYREFEVICVDDLSTDGSCEYLEQVAKEDPRFKVIKRTSKGGTAVKGVAYGLPYCTGEYEFYVSQDDLMAPDMFEKCIRRAQETGAEVVLPDMTLYHQGKHSFTVYAPNKDHQTILSGPDAFVGSLNWAVHGASLRSMDLVRRTGLDTDYFNSCEYAVHKSYLLANKVAFCDSLFYYRQDNPDAITKKTYYFTFDVLTTNVRLLRLMFQYQLPTREIRRSWRTVFNSLPEWKERYQQHAASFTPQQQQYAQQAISAAEKELGFMKRRLGFWPRLRQRTFSWAARKFHSLCLAYKIKMYRYLSDQWPTGGFLTLTPCLFVGQGQFLLAEPVVLGFFPSADCYSTHIYVEARGKDAVVEIGSNTAISNNAMLVAIKQIRIGRNCRIGSRFMCLDSDFHALSPRERDNADAVKSEAIFIEDDVFIGNGVTILKGVTLGAGCVVGAGSVVTRSFEAGSIIAGNPAKFIKKVE